MDKQDDLASIYKNASVEQPSSELDEMIIAAAAQALNSDKESNVVKGKFSVRRWQTPVSIAAAAILTISFIGSYQPWLENTQPETSIDLHTAELDIAQDDSIQISSPRSIPPPSAQVSMDTPSAEMISASSMKKSSIKNSARKRKKSDQFRQLATYSIDDSIKQETQAESAQALSPSILSESLETDSSANASAVMPEKREPTPKSIEKWLTRIEEKMQSHSLEVAKSDKLALLLQHPIESFSESELKRLALIEKQLSN